MVEIPPAAANVPLGSDLRKIEIAVEDQNAAVDNVVWSAFEKVRVREYGVIGEDVAEENCAGDFSGENRRQIFVGGFEEAGAGECAARNSEVGWILRAGVGDPAVGDFVGVDIAFDGGETLRPIDVRFAEDLADVALAA